MNETTSNPYEAPKADLNAQQVSSGASGSLDDAVAGRYRLEIGDVMREAWAKTRGMKAAFWGGAVLLYLAYMVAAVIGGRILKDSPVWGVLFSIVLGLTAPVLSLGLVTMGIRRAAGLRVSFETAFKSFNKAVPAMIAGLLTTVLVYIGTFLLILPGIYLGISYCMVMPLIADRDISPWRAMETSRRAVTKRWFEFFGLMFLVGLVVFASLLPLGIGLIWSVPWAVNVIGVTYRCVFGVAQAE
jgi:uncharacterized membrane protein